MLKCQLKHSGGNINTTNNNTINSNHLNNVNSGTDDVIADDDNPKKPDNENEMIIEEPRVPELQEMICMLKNRRRGFTESTKKKIAAKQCWKCNHCERTLPHNYVVDHIRAICFGGKNEISNAQALCKECHDRKTKLEGVQRKCRKLHGVEDGKGDLSPIDYILPLLLQKATEVCESIPRKHESEENVLRC